MSDESLNKFGGNLYKSIIFYGILQHIYKNDSTLSYTTTKFQTAVTLVLTIKAMSIPVVLPRLARYRTEACS